MKSKNYLIPLLQITTAGGLMLFWAFFFSVGLMSENASQCYLVFERAFPVPDLTLALGLLSGGFLSLKGYSLGRKISLASGGALMFLGLIDISFNIQNGIYSRSLLDFIFNAVINLWVLCVGAIILAKLK